MSAAEAWAMALVSIFCTPLGWIGILIFGVSIMGICDAIRGGDQ